MQRRNMSGWLVGYISWALRRRPASHGTRHVLFCFVDHFEPRWRNASLAQERQRVDRWIRDYPEICAPFRDCDGFPPRHTFFFPEEEYRPEHLAKIASLCARGFGEVEVHLHHDQDTEEGLRKKLRSFTRTLADVHGLLPQDPVTKQPLWSFIHGNWALDNSRPDGRQCGVNNELTILREEGCYADFTFPSAPDVTQPRTVNSIYYAKDDPAAPKSHDRGVPVRVGSPATGDIMLIQGVLGLNWGWRKFGVLPRLENSDVRGSSKPLPARVDYWVRSGIHVEGRPEWIFVKVHTHGTQERDIDTLLGPDMSRMFEYLQTAYNDGTRYRLHYVTAREMYNIAKAAEAGERGEPGDFRDFRIPAPPVSAKPSAQTGRTSGAIG